MPNSAFINTSAASSYYSTSPWGNAGGAGWISVSGAPFVVVSATGLSTAGVTLPNNGADFGPDTAGTTTSGIQEAITSLGTGGGTVYLLPGIFKVTAGTITIAAKGITLQGGNDPSTSAGATEILDNRPSNSGHLLKIGTGSGSLNDLSIHGIAFQTANTQSGYAQLYLFGTVNGVWVYSCLFHANNKADYGMWAAPNGASNGNNLYINNCDLNGANVSNVYWQQIQGESVISNLQIGTSTGNGIWIDSNGAGPLQIYGNNVTNCAIACNLTSNVNGLSDLNIFGNSFTQSTSYGMAFTGTHPMNEIRVDSCHIGSSVYPVYVTSAIDNVQFSNCHIEKSQNDGVYLNPSSAKHPGIQFTGCDISRNAGAGINVAAPVHLLATGNQLGDGTYYGGGPVQTYAVLFSTAVTSGTYFIVGNDMTGLVTGTIGSPGNAQSSLTVINNPGGNPFGLISTPILVTGHILGINGASSTFVASTTYTCGGTPLLILSTGGTSVSITIKDNLGNTIVSGAVTIPSPGFMLHPNWTINFGAFSPGPTVTVYGT